MLELAVVLSKESLDSECYQHRMSERTINEKLLALGFTREDVDGDGNCFFASVAVVLNHRSFQGRVDWTQAELRELGVNYLREHPDMFPAIDEMEPYIGRMSGDREWADGPIISAVGLALQVRLAVVIIDQQQAARILQSFTNNAWDTLHVFYSSNHYQALLPQ